MNEYNVDMLQKHIRAYQYARPDARRFYIVFALDKMKRHETLTNAENDALKDFWTYYTDAHKKAPHG